MLSYRDLRADSSLHNIGATVTELWLILRQVVGGNRTSITLSGYSG